MVAYLFSDLILVARHLGGREPKLQVDRDPIRLADIIDVEYGANGNGKQVFTCLNSTKDNSIWKFKKQILCVLSNVSFVGISISLNATLWDGFEKHLKKFLFTC